MFDAAPLGDMGSGEAAQELAATLLRDTSRGRVCAAVALRNLGPKAAPAVPLIVEALTDSESKVRYRAAHILWSIGPAANEAGRSLLPLLKDRDPKVRTYAAIALVAIEYRPSPVKDLERILREDKEASLKNAAKWVRTEADEVLRDGREVRR